MWAACQKGDEQPPQQDASAHWAVKGLQRVVPVKWSDETDGACWAHDAEGHVFVTRSLALVVTIGCSDLTFSSDNITAVLALVTPIDKGSPTHAVEGSATVPRGVGTTRV